MRLFTAIVNIAGFDNVKCVIANSETQARSILERTYGDGPLPCKVTIKRSVPAPNVPSPKR